MSVYIKVDFRLHIHDRRLTIALIVSTGVGQEYLFTQESVGGTVKVRSSE